MNSHDWNVAQELLHSQPGHDGATAEHAKQAERTEEVQWAGKIPQQETNRDQIEDHAEGAGNAVVRGAALAVYVADGHFANRRAVPRGQRRDEAMQLAVERHLLQDLAAIGFEGGAEVV